MLKTAAPVEASFLSSMGMDGEIDLSNEELDALLSMAAMAINGLIHDWLKRQKIEAAAAEQWAKVTRAVWGKYLRRQDVGIAIWVLVSVNVFYTPALPETAAGGGK